MTTQTALIIDRIPFDVHTIIFGYLNLQDSISLLKTSCALYFTRYLWVIVLDFARKLRPLPSPQDQDFSESVMHFSALRRLACTACRLEQNWSQEQPQYKSVVQAQTSGPQLPVAIVPGRGIIITVALQKRQLQCWNVATQSCLGIIEKIYVVIEPVCDGSPFMCRPYMDNNRFVLGLITCENRILDSSAQVVVVSVDHSDDNIKFTENFRTPLLLPSPTYKREHANIAMSSPSTGFVVYHNHEISSEAYCAAFDGTLNSMTPITIPLPSAVVYMRALFIHRGFLHICVLNKHTGRMDSVSLSGSELLANLGYTDTSMILRDTAYTAFAYNTRIIKSPAVRPSGLEISIWTGRERYEFKFPYQKSIGCYGYVPGTDTTRLCFLKFGKPDQCFLFRFHFDMVPPTCTRHSLTLPPTVVQDFLGHCPTLIDEHFGIIYVFNKSAIQALFYV